MFSGPISLKISGGQTTSRVEELAAAKELAEQKRRSPARARKGGAERAQAGEKLMAAVRAGEKQRVQKIAARHPEACLWVDKRGRTALHVAAAEGQTAIVQILSRAEPGAAAMVCARGRTPLHYAARDGHAHSLEVLLGLRSVRTSLLDRSGMSVLDYARRAPKSSSQMQALIEQRRPANLGSKSSRAVPTHSPIPVRDEKPIDTTRSKSSSPPGLRRQRGRSDPDRRVVFDDASNSDDSSDDDIDHRRSIHNDDLFTNTQYQRLVDLLQSRDDEIVSLKARISVLEAQLSNPD